MLEIDKKLFSFVILTSSFNLLTKEQKWYSINTVKSYLRKIKEWLGANYRYILGGLFFGLSLGSRVNFVLNLLFVQLCPFIIIFILFLGLFVAFNENLKQAFLETSVFLGSSSVAFIAFIFFKYYFDYSYFLTTFFWLVASVGIVTICYIYKEIKKPEPEEKKEETSPLSDHPITEKELEKIREGKEGLFQSFFKNLDYTQQKINSDKYRLGLDKGGYSICIDSNWGSGKSSFINMLRGRLQPEIYINFEPWNYNNKNDLIEDFFNKLNYEIKKAGYKGLGLDLKKYVKLVDASFGKGLVSVVFSLFGLIDSKPLGDLKDSISSSLKKIEPKIIVTIDNIDRMEPEEIMLTLKLVKMVADFPNIIFILPMDYDKVRAIITKECGEQYKNYLQKIVNNRVILEKYKYKELEAIFDYCLKDEVKTLSDGEKSLLFELYCMRSFYHFTKDKINFWKSNGSLNIHKNDSADFYPPENVEKEDFGLSLGVWEEEQIAFNKTSPNTDYSLGRLVRDILDHKFVYISDIRNFFANQIGFAITSDGLMGESSRFDKFEDRYNKFLGISKFMSDVVSGTQLLINEKVNSAISVVGEMLVELKNLKIKGWADVGRYRSTLARYNYDFTSFREANKYFEELNNDLQILNKDEMAFIKINKSLNYYKELLDYKRYFSWIEEVGITPRHLKEFVNEIIDKLEKNQSLDGIVDEVTSRQVFY